MTETLGQQAVGRHGACQDEWELDQLVCWLGHHGMPKLVVEIGSDRGGTLWLWQQLKCEVIAVTLHTRQDGIFNGHGAWVVVGNSADPVVRDQAVRLLAGRTPDLVFVDGGHDYVTALADIRWGLQLAPSGLTVVHDIEYRPGHPEIETHIAFTEAADVRPHIRIVRRSAVTPGVGIIYPRDGSHAQPG